MSPARNTTRRYGTVAMALHWVMAVLVIGLVALGLYMTSLPDAGFDKLKIQLFVQHKQFGMLALFLVLARLAWRFGNRLPRLVEGMPEWQQVAARFVHLCFYALLVALPLTGWLMSSAAGIPVNFFQLGYLPDLIGFNDYRFELLVTAHKALGYTLIAFILVHAGAALQHHFVDRDETLRNMLPVSRRSPSRSEPRPSASAP
jgi:cytochrome b561